MRMLGNGNCNVVRWLPFVIWGRGFMDCCAEPGGKQKRVGNRDHDMDASLLSGILLRMFAP